MAMDDGRRPAGALSVLTLRALARCYIDGMLAHQVAGVPLSANFRATENTRTTTPGSGLWQSIRGLPGIPSWFVDETTGQVILMGAAQLEEALKPFVLRLRISGGEILESEAIISDSTKGHFADVDQLLMSDILYDAPVPATRRGDRSALQVAADRYWNAIAASDGSLVRVNYRADRFGNGKKITNNLSILLSPDAAVHSVASLITATRPARPVVREKRFPLLDVERGIAASLVIVEFADNPAHPRPDTGAFYTMTVFKIVDDEIRCIDAIHQIMPRGTRSGW